MEYKISVSEWLLNSTSANYLLHDRDYDSHTPLLIGVLANQYTGGRAKAMSRNPDTLQEKAGGETASEPSSWIHRAGAN